MTAVLVGAGGGPVRSCYWCGADVTGANGIIVHVATGEAASLVPFRHFADTDANRQWKRLITTYGRDGWPI